MKGIYVWTNNKNGKQYVGRSAFIEGRAMEHTHKNAKGLLAKAIREYGLDCFSLELHSYPGLHPGELHLKEREWILKLNTLKPNGYNSCLPHPYLIEPSLLCHWCERSYSRKYRENGYTYRGKFYCSEACFAEETDAMY